MQFKNFLSVLELATTAYEREIFCAESRQFNAVP